MTSPTIPDGNRNPGLGLEPGRLIAQYRIARQVGAGAMGVVYLARDVDLDRDVAIKVLRADVAAMDSRFNDRFLREARSAARLSHPNVAAVHQVGRQDGLAFIAMEWLDGGSLADHLRRSVILDWREATEAVRDAAAGLAAAHAAGLVHRDVKPSNLMRTRAGVVKLVDFGLARDVSGDSDLTQTGGVLGTPAYLSPEQCRGEPATPLADQYCLACTWFHLLTSRPPFANTSLPGMLYQHQNEPVPDPRRFAAEVPEAVGRILLRAAAKEPSDRYPSAEALLADLTALLDSTGHGGLTRQKDPATQRPPITWVSSALRWGPSLRRAVAAVVLLGALAAGGAVVARRAGWFGKATTADKSIDVRPVNRGGTVVGRDHTNSIAMKFVRIEPGTFMMGSPVAEEERDFDGRHDEAQHTVTITRPYYIGVTEVTQAQWRAVMGGSPSHFQGDDLPVEQVSWDDANECCRRLGAKEGRSYRLPTEAEWEYAARAGTTTPFSAGETISTDQANFKGTNPYGGGEPGIDRRSTTPVGSFPPNPWGLYDMQGNLWEWCWDYYDPLYPSGPVTDPRGPSAGVQHVARGGSWYGPGRYCRSAARGQSPPNARMPNFGFRVVMDAEGSP